MTVSFRPLAVGDLPLLGDWLRAEHVQLWWRDESSQALVEAKYLPRIRGEQPTEVFVVDWDGRPVGMIQRYRIADHPDWDATIPASVRRDRAAGIDYLIAEPGRGFGTEMVAAFTTAVFEEYPDVDAIVVVPQAGNRASCRVLEKAGYRLAWTGQLASDDPSDAGPAALYVLDRPVQQSSAT